MKKAMTSLSIGAAFTVLAVSSLIGTYQKRMSRIGDIDEFGGTIVQLNNDNNNHIRFKPLVTPTDTYYSKQKTYSMSNVGDIETTWDYYTGEGVTVAVIDSGFTYGHEDFIRDGKSIFSDKSGYVYTDDYGDYFGDTHFKLASSDSWSCMKHEYDSDYHEWETHGSNVTGCVAAVMNGVGTVGIAPNANILALKVDFWDPSIAYAIKYAADNGADIINMSLGAYDISDPHTSDDSYDGCKESFEDAINYAYSKGVIIIAAAGNESTSAKSYPACNDHVVGVGALDQNSSTQAASFSNFNKNSDTQSNNHNVDVMAPGYVWAPGLDGNELYNSSSNYPKFGYSETQGTSFASPITAGAAALWKEKHPTGNQDDFESDLYNSAVNMGSFAKYGNGRLDVYELLDIEEELSGITVDKSSITAFDNEESFTLTATSKEGTVTDVSVGNTSIITKGDVSTSGNSMTATFNIVGTGSTKITFTDSLNKTKDVPVTVSEYVEVNGIETTETSGRSVSIGKSFNIGASVLPSNASDKTLAYESKDATIATVNDEGLVTGQQVGDTSIVITAHNGFNIEFDVSVVESTSETYTVVFTSGTESDREVNYLDEVIESDEDNIIANSYCSKVYKGSLGAKFSSRRSDGYAQIILSDTLDINTITVKAAAYKDSDSNVTITINNKTVELTRNTELNDYVLNFYGEEINTLEIEASKRLYLKSFVIETGSTFVPVDSVSLNKNSLTLDEGETFQLSATVLPDNATNKTVSYSSNVTDVATVSSTGLVKAVSEGTATIKVVTNSGAKIDECVVKVNKVVVPVTGVSISKSSLVLGLDDSAIVYARVEPSNATNQNVTWSTSDDKVATVEDGLITSVGVGTATITVTTKDGGFTSTMTVTVTDEQIIAVTGVTLSKSSLELKAGTTSAVRAEVEPANATNKNVSWSSSNERVATVEDGMISAVSRGSATITATTEDGGFTASLSVVVTESDPEVYVTEIEITQLPDKLEYVVDEYLDLEGMEVVGHFSDGTDCEITAYTCDVTKLTTVGTVVVTISYTYGGHTVTDQFTISVTSGIPTFIGYQVESYPTKKTYTVGDEFSLVGLSVNALYSDGSSVKYTGSVLASGYDMNKAGTYTVTLNDGSGIAIGSYQIVVNEAKKGCFGSVATTSTILASIALVGIGALLLSKFLKKKED